MDATHIKACANSKRGKKSCAARALFYKESLRKKMDKDPGTGGEKFYVMTEVLKRKLRKEFQLWNVKEIMNITILL